jgi:multiple sugar transport system substrate-binding protein
MCPDNRSNKKMISRRDFLKVGGLTGLAASSVASILAACSPTATQSPSETQGSAQSTGIELRAIAFNIPWGLAFRDEIAAAFQKETGIKVTVDVTPYDTLQEKVFLELGAGSSSYDIITTDCIWVGACLNSNWVLSVEDMKAKNPSLPDIKWDTVIPDALPYIADLNGKKYGIPASLTTPTLAYRKDLFEKWGLQAPKTWDEYYQLLDDVTAKIAEDGLKDFYPTCLVQNSQDPGYSDWTYHLFGYGKVADKGDGYVLSAEGKPIFNVDGRGVKALNELHDILPYCPQGTLGFDYGEASNLFNSGKSAMLLTWNDFYSDTENPDFSTVAGNVGYAAIPAHEIQVNPVGGFQLFINAASKHPEEAYKLLAWMMEGPAFDMILQKGETGILVRKDLNDPAVLARLPFLAAWKDIQNSAYIPVWFENFTEVQRIIWEEVANSLAGKKTSEQAMQDAETRVAEIMG